MLGAVKISRSQLSHHDQIRRIGSHVVYLKAYHHDNEIKGALFISKIQII